MLHNGIRLPHPWPPRYPPENFRTPVAPPYLADIPQVIPIDRGRQLFVDDFLISESTLKRSYHTARLHPENPVLKPETTLELNGGLQPVACPFNDGVFYDPEDRLFKMWYHAGWFDGIAYATSRDGIHWTRPRLDVEPGTNRVLVRGKGYERDGVGIWLDQETSDRQQRFKMFAFFRGPDSFRRGEVYTSADGIHWDGPTPTGPCGDNTTFFYNPFRKVWVYSIRTFQFEPRLSRLRGYREHSDFVEGAAWEESDVHHWAGADELDPPAPDLGHPTQLYNVDAAGYESLMIGLLAIHRGPPNRICLEGGFPKLTELCLGFSRDGFHWHRPDRRSFIAPSRRKGAWNRAYLHSAGGCCLVVGDQLYFYFGAWSGESPKLGGHMYAGGSTGLAVLRRDGFASLDAPESGGAVTTRPLRFQGRHLFVNLQAPRGQLQAEVLDGQGVPIAPFSRQNCLPVSGDSTLSQVVWKEAADLSILAGRPVRFRFHLTNGRLYSFWVSPDEIGASNGYLAGGGPGFTGPSDTVGRGAG
ncbi:MAG: glycosyl hydrolase family 32 [Acidobacteria bacterium]|nr:glycosyl hydrolase family 32 [Acidobacteriota bacterium]